MSSYKPTESQTEAMQSLSRFLSAGDTVYCLTRSVSRSGMSRKISFFVVDKTDNRLLDATWLICAILGCRVYDVAGSNAMQINGGGMDMHFHVVYCLSQKMFGDGYKLRKESL